MLRSPRWRCPPPRPYRRTVASPHVMRHHASRRCPFGCLSHSARQAAWLASKNQLLPQFPTVLLCELRHCPRGTKRHSCNVASCSGVTDKNMIQNADNSRLEFASTWNGQAGNDAPSAGESRRPVLERRPWVQPSLPTSFRWATCRRGRHRSSPAHPPSTECKPTRVV